MGNLYGHVDEANFGRTERICQRHKCQTRTRGRRGRRRRGGGGSQSVGNWIVREKTPPWQGLPSGPMILAVHLNKLSPSGATLQLERGSRCRTCSSRVIRFCAICKNLCATARFPLKLMYNSVQASAARSAQKAAACSCACYTRAAAVCCSLPGEIFFCPRAITRRVCPNEKIRTFSPFAFLLGEGSVVIRLGCVWGVGVKGGRRVRGEVRGPATFLFMLVMAVCSYLKN